MDAVLVVNAQNSWLSPSGSVYLGKKAEILKIRMMDCLSRFSGEKIFFREVHSLKDTFFASERTHSVVMSPDSMIENSLKPYADVFFDKTRYSAFFDTGLADYLKRKKFNYIGLMGVETHTSILFTAEELCNRGYEVRVIEPCTAARDDWMHTWAISLMVNFLSVRLGDVP